jgi:hypothetical protein
MLRIPVLLRLLRLLWPAAAALLGHHISQSGIWLLLWRFFFYFE